MEMLLFLNESYIFHRLRMWSTVLWRLCFVSAELGIPIIGVPRCLIKPFSVPVTFPLSVNRISNFRFGPSYRKLIV
ncbi:BAF_HP2_G0000040.mRNA.1.CDS.1 [Saccharomyces cerevisiae]|nr:BAF_HP2_G0000040.mRNA.1.CDS.1 [Saccharomyces cerevisiae]CAI6380890.1 BAF_HP2_G0000040.mRNA.1.CDS.1 [Saccharomyces cerevisiae]